MKDFCKQLRWRLEDARRGKLRQGICQCISASGRRQSVMPYLDGHILILGGNTMALGILNAIAQNSAFAGKEVLLMSDQDTADLWRRLIPRLSTEAQELSLTLCLGRCNTPSGLVQCQVERASHIFIVGEEDDVEHDALNVDCWNHVRNLCTGAAATAQCYLYLMNDTSANLFHKLPQEAHNGIETTIINHCESVAQQLLSGNGEGDDRRTLDRGLVTSGSDRYVHFFIVGMTPMGCALASTAAHLCHFPNFDESAAQPVRTKITFIDSHADDGMARFMGTHQSLFALSHSTYRDAAGSCVHSQPDSSMGDFLDVEWEFVKGNIADPWVREMLETAAEDCRQVLSVALCNERPEDNVEQAVSLPAAFYSIPEEDTGSGNEPLVYVYQPFSGALLDMVRMAVLRYRNVLPFGMDACSYDPLLVQRIAAAKRLNYLRQKEDSGKDFVSMPAGSEVCDDMWRQLSFGEKMANLYLANASGTMLRSLGISAQAGATAITDDDVLETLCRIERARWNMEKLLVGFSAMPTVDRTALNKALQNPSEEIRQEARIVTNRSKNQLFVNKDIAPYAELPDAVKDYDRTILRNLPLSMLPAICKV